MTSPAGTSTSRTITARAALAGNPSDGYGGAVLSVPVPAYSATVTVSEQPAPGPTLAENLLAATLRRFSLDVSPVGDLHLHAMTTIPRSVGLAGSSAIVIAALRALAAHYGADLADREVAQLAHRIERTDLDIPGGWQDQIIQSDPSGCPVLMEFAEPMHHRALHPRSAAPALLPGDTEVPDNTEVFVIWGAFGAQSSAIPHRDLRSRADQLAEVMSELAGLARKAAAAIESGDTAALGSAINQTFDLRETIMAIEPAHRSMIDVARGAGAPCNFAGSGGAIAGLVPPDRERFTSVVEQAGLTVEMWQLEVPSGA